jgi:hypothetical protein
MGLSLNDENRRCDAVAKKSTLKNYLKTVTYEHANCTLTSGADTLEPQSQTAAMKTTVGDDIFRAPTDGFLTSADYVDGGAGTDSLTASVTANSQTIAPVLKSVENVTLTIAAADAKTTTFNAVDTLGITTLTIKDAGAVSADRTGTILGFATTSDELILLSNLAKTTTLGIIGGTANTGATSADITARFASAAAADTQKLSISTLGNVGIVNLATAETVQITATGTGTTGANTIGTLSAGAVKTLNLLGSGDLTIGASDLAAAPTINASAATGKISFTGETGATTTTFTGGSGATTVTTATTGIVSITTGAGADVITLSGASSTATVNTGDGNDDVIIGAQATVTAADAIVGGAGTDTITISDATINATTKTTLALGVSGFEVLATSAVAETTVDFNALSTYDVVTITTASTVTAQAAAAATPALAGLAAVAATMENADRLVIAANRTGMIGQASTNVKDADLSGAGGNGVTITPLLDNGSNIASIQFVGNVTLTGGKGGVSAGGAATDLAGDGGIGLSASGIETLNIDVSGTAATGTSASTVTLTGGAGGATGTSGTIGATGATLVISTNATVNVTSSLTGATAAVHNNLNLGTVIGTNATINASTFAGALTVTAASGNVSITGGLGADALTGGAGTDVISGGAGADVITGAAAKDTLSGGAGRDSFTIGTAGHSGVTTADTISDFGKVTIAITAAQVNAMTGVTAFQATATAAGGADADVLDMVGTAALRAATTGIDVAAAVTGNPVTAANLSAKGVVTVSGVGASSVDTLAEWVAVANLAATTASEVAVFEFGGNTYVFQQGTTDDLFQLTGVTGVTGIVIVGGSVAAAVGDIFVI